MSATTHQWSELLSLLTQGRTEKDVARKCSVRLLDTIYILPGGDVNSPQWYFTTKSGSIARKKGDKASLAGVYERFSKFALANPNNSQRTVGVFVHGNGYRQQLSENGLKDMLIVNSSVLLQEGSHLQVFLRPYQGRDETASCHIQKASSGKLEFSYVFRTSNGSTRPITSSGIQDQMRGFAQEVIEHLIDSRGVICTKVQLDFIVDDNEHVWLSHIPSVELTQKNQEIKPNYYVII